MDAIGQTKIKGLAIMEPELRRAIGQAAAILKAAGAEAVYIVWREVKEQVAIEQAQIDKLFEAYEPVIRTAV
jgi:hypothetical protein